MIEIQEDKNKLDVIFPPQIIDEEWKKYNKRMDDMIDDAEIEAELEAENKIRSKNSRVLSISIVAIALLFLVFLKVQQHSNTSQTRTSKISSTEETALLSKKTQPINSQPGQLSPAAASVKQLTKASVKAKSVASDMNENSTPKHIEIVKPSKPDVAKQIYSMPDKKHYVQLGAFSVKENAEKFANKVKSRGFNTVISIRDTKSTQYQVFIGNFKDKSMLKSKLADLNVSGFSSSMKKANNTYILEIEALQNREGSNSLVKKLRNQGYTPRVKNISITNKTYTVRVEGLETENAAQKARLKLANQGFKNSFIR